MSEKPIPDIDVDELMRRIRREVEARRVATPATASRTAATGTRAAPADVRSADTSSHRISSPRHLRLFEELLSVSRKTTAFVRGLAGQVAALATAQKALAVDRAALRREMQEEYAQLDGLLRTVQQQVQFLSEQASRREHDLAYVKGDLTLQRLVLARQLGGTMPGDGGRAGGGVLPPASEAASPADGAKDLFGAFYVALESRFRGSREDIRQRLRYYLERLDLLAPAGTPRQVVDLGVGRGEWLELLREHAHQGRGVDLNADMVAECTSRGLDVVEQDAVAFLRSLPDASVDVVTAFHVIEHLEFAPLLTLIQESYRVLRGGGVVILETPNPDNLLVASQSFYLDPSHLHVLPSPYTAFLLEHVGFRAPEIVPLHPNLDATPLTLGDEGAAHELNRLLYGPQDYAAIGTR